MRRQFVALLAAALLSSQAGAAESKPPTEKVEILPIDFSAEGLSGPGGERLRGDMEQAQFIALGEDHGLAGSPQLGEALAHDAAAIAARQGGGSLYHAVEVGPHTVDWVKTRLAAGGIDALGKGLDSRPWAMPFLVNVEDARLAAPFAATNRLWGIDQEFIGAPSILFDRLSASAKDEATRTLLAAWRERDRAALSDGKFGDITMAITTPQQFADLRARFSGDREAEAIVDALAESARIYGLNNSGQYLQNNEKRAALMQRYFLAAYRAAPTPAPRVLLKMGANHLGRGTTPTSIYDLGSVLPGLAAANGRTMVNIAYIPVSGTVRYIKPGSTGFTQVDAYTDEVVSPILAAAGIDRTAIPAEGHVLIPLAPLRHNLQGKALRDLPAFARFTLLGFDYLVTTRGAVAATHFEAVGGKAP